MLEKQYQLLSEEPVSQTYTSPIFPYGNESGWILVVRIIGAPTGTTPSLLFDIATSPDGVTFTQVGANLTALTAVGVQVVPYITGSTQGAFPGGTRFFQVVGTLTGTNAVFPNVHLDLVAFM